MARITINNPLAIERMHNRGRLRSSQTILPPFSAVVPPIGPARSREPGVDKKPVPDEAS